MNTATPPVQPPVPLSVTGALFAGFWIRVAAAILDGLGGAERRLIGGEDEGRPLRDDLSEAGGALEAAGEGPDAVDASEVRQRRQPVRDGGPAGELSAPAQACCGRNRGGERGLASCAAGRAIPRRGHLPRGGIPGTRPR